jgi:hypothetical protein
MTRAMSFYTSSSALLYLNMHYYSPNTLIIKGSEGVKSAFQCNAPEKVSTENAAKILSWPCPSNPALCKETKHQSFPQVPSSPLTCNSRGRQLYDGALISVVLVSPKIRACHYILLLALTASPKCPQILPMQSAADQG